uniref:Reverse transcriptase domain-containing protein n=1 Tax=Amphimedon queenslandica TaxID=400682 RepID=A0A1X7TMJ3_AMPQE
MEVDTGAAFSKISERTYHNYFPTTSLQPSDIALRTYSGETITTLGSLNSFKVMGPLLGWNWLEVICLNWNHIHNNVQPQAIDSLIGRFSSVFTDELGLFEGGSITIQTLPSAKHKFFKPCPQHGIITPVNFSSWAAPIVPVLKPDDSVRICGDYKVTVNTVLQVDTYPLPRIEDLFSMLTGGTLFFKLDLAHAYQQIALDEESRKLTTINTHKGLFQCNRLPFGITSASIFQLILETILANIPGVCVYLNDTLVSGIDEHDHKQTLFQVQSKLDSAGFTLKNAKCQFGLKSICYLVHVIDRHCLHPSPDRVKAMQEALERYSRKMPHGHGQKLKGKHFQRVKALLQSSSILVHYDSTKPLILSVDASAYGLGAVLIHQMTDGCDKPVSFASRSISQAENYSQIEKRHWRLY